MIEDPWIKKVGYAIGTFYGFRSDGLLTQEDIDTKNDRWLQYMMMLEMQAEWDAREAAAKAAEEAEKAEQA